MTAMHGNWPLGAWQPAARDINFSDPVSQSAEQIHSQLFRMSDIASQNETKAFELRKEATGRGICEKEKSRMCEEATRLEENAEKCRREADRLRAEAEAVDRELARELEEEHEREFGGQQSGVVPGAFD